MFFDHVSKYLLQIFLAEGCFVVLLLEMLVIFAGFPRSTPTETVLQEESAEQVVAGDFIRIPCRTVAIPDSGDGRYLPGAVGSLLAVGVVERVDVYRHTIGMTGQGGLTTGSGTVVEAGAVVGLHGAFVVGTVSVYDFHALYGIGGTVEGAEDVQEVGDNGAMAYHLSYSYATVTVVMEHTQIAQLTTGDGGLMTIGGGGHGAKEGVGEGVGGEKGVYALPFHPQGVYRIARMKVGGLRPCGHPQTTY